MDYNINKIDGIQNKIDGIENKIDYILECINNKISKSCTKMDNHITFIEKVYDIIKYPLFFIVDKINLLSTNKMNLLSTNKKKIKL